MTATRQKPRIVQPAMEIDAANRFCTCCGRPLTGRAAWLELDQRVNRYHDFGVPPENSQGWFPFGMTCARKALEAETRLTA